MGGLGPVGLAEELEGDQGVQERCLFVAEGSGREGGQSAPARPGCRDDETHEGAGRLHRRGGGGAVQGRHLPLLSLSFIGAPDSGSAAFVRDASSAGLAFGGAAALRRRDGVDPVMLLSSTEKRKAQV